MLPVYRAYVEVSSFAYKTLLYAPSAGCRGKRPMQHSCLNPTVSICLGCCQRFARRPRSTLDFQECPKCCCRQDCRSWRATMFIWEPLLLDSCLNLRPLGLESARSHTVLNTGRQLPRMGPAFQFCLYQP